MLVYRACKERYAEKMDGEGARQTGGRWNSKGFPVIYTASNAPLAILETLVHVGDMGLIPDDYVMVEILLPDDVSLQTISEEQLPLEFRRTTSTRVSRNLGNQWLISKASLVLKVPSAILPNHYNMLINSAHPDIKQASVISIASFQTFDFRLFQLKMTHPK